MEPRWAFYYDGDCGMCRRIIAVLSSLDVRRSITWVPFQSLNDPPGGLGWDDLDRSAYFDRGKPPLLAGFHAFKALTLRLPLLWPLAPIFLFAGHRPARRNHLPVDSRPPACNIPVQVAGDWRYP